MNSPVDPDPENDFRQPGDCETFQGVVQAGQNCVREHPLSFAAGALIFGIVIGALCFGRESKPKDARVVARDLLDEFVSHLSDRLPDFKKKAHCPASVWKRFEQTGKSLKWW